MPGQGDIGAGCASAGSLPDLAAGQSEVRAPESALVAQLARLEAEVDVAVAEKKHALLAALGSSRRVRRRLRRSRAGPRRSC